MNCRPMPRLDSSILVIFCCAAFAQGSAFVVDPCLRRRWRNPQPTATSAVTHPIRPFESSLSLSSPLENGKRPRKFPSTRSTTRGLLYSHSSYHHHHQPTSSSPPSVLAQQVASLWDPATIGGLVAVAFVTISSVALSSSPTTDVEQVNALVAPTTATARSGSTKISQTRSNAIDQSFVGAPKAQNRNKLPADQPPRQQKPLTKIRNWTAATVAATLVLSLLQAGVALMQYRSNPVGHLVIPAGPTTGVEVVLKPEEPHGHNKADDEELDLSKKNHHPQPVSSSSWMDLYFATQEEQDEKLVDTSVPPYYDWMQRSNRFLVLLLPWLVHQLNALILQQAHLLYLGVLLSVFQFWSANNGIKFDVDKDGMTSTTTTTMAIQQQQRQQQQQSHSDSHSTSNHTEAALTTKPSIKRVLVIGDSLAIGLGSINRFKVRPPEMPYFQLIENPVGASHNNNTSTALPLSISNSSTHNAASLTNDGEEDQRPVFPRVLAEVLAEKEHCAIGWRSAGVDGGAVSHIREYCLPVLQQEVDHGRTPDYIVVLCGMNDLKYQFAEHPWNAFSPQTYRRDLARLFRDIQWILESSGSTDTAKTRIILPAMPVQLFLKNSAVGIFPLAFLLGIIVGYWDSQKKLMADRASSSWLSSSRRNEKSLLPLPIEYLPMSKEAVQEWYDKESLSLDSPKSNNIPHHNGDRDIAAIGEVQNDEMDTGFVSADGIHPNAKCYALWAEYVANHLAFRATAKGNTTSTKKECKGKILCRSRVQTQSSSLN